LMAAMRDSRGASTPEWQDRFSALALVSTVGGTLFLVSRLLWRGRRRESSDETASTLVPLVLAGLVINAAVCAALAAPLDRFQARVVWLLPLLAAGLAARAALRRTPAGASRRSAWRPRTAQVGNITQEGQP